ncbi:hypothetical protein FGO68_gene14563 [Halteria grandinella]|uniref:Uncharacterized protein n=1 Tax=Halteria grandinella TaxID=5974 RepID=A0A8J8NJW6_HALGN|nr:hypothetical protein FGO68_gene14563 [Halteria grandinella]
MTSYPVLDILSSPPLASALFDFLQLIPTSTINHIFVGVIGALLPLLNYVGFLLFNKNIKSLGGFIYIGQVIASVIKYSIPASIVIMVINIVLIIIGLDFLMNNFLIIDIAQPLLGAPILYYAAPIGQIFDLFMKQLDKQAFIEEALEENVGPSLADYLQILSDLITAPLDELSMHLVPFYILTGYSFLAVKWISNNSDTFLAQSLKDLEITRSLVYYFPMVGLYANWIDFMLKLFSLGAGIDSFRHLVNYSCLGIISYIEFVLPATLNVGEMVYA